MRDGGPPKAQQERECRSHMGEMSRVGKVRERGESKLLASHTGGGCHVVSEEAWGLRVCGGVASRLQEENMESSVHLELHFTNFINKLIIVSCVCFITCSIRRHVI